MTHSTLKHSGFRIGQEIKAFDFPPMADRPDLFVQGRIISIPKDRGYDCYEVAASHVSSSHYKLGVSVFVPFETFIEFDNRVQGVK